MVQGIGFGGGIGRQAIEAALKRMSEKVETDVSGPNASSTDASGFAEQVKENLADLDASLVRSEQIHVEAVQGTVDLHEVSAQLKQSELSFQFAMQVRNKFIDAYREVMRMSV